MPTPSPNSITVRVVSPSGAQATGQLTAAIAAAGGALTALDVVESHHDQLVIDVTCNTTDDEHAKAITAVLARLPGFEVRKVSDRTFLMHLGGTIRVEPKVSLRTRDDLSRAYTPGVARVC
jgi:malate dehydrogenase (oxaloacetate-decarboxylating)